MLGKEVSAKLTTSEHCICPVIAMQLHDCDAKPVGRKQGSIQSCKRRDISVACVKWIGNNRCLLDYEYEEILTVTWAEWFCSIFISISQWILKMILNYFAYFQVWMINLANRMTTPFWGSAEEQHDFLFRELEASHLFVFFPDSALFHLFNTKQCMQNSWCWGPGWPLPSDISIGYWRWDWDYSFRILFAASFSGANGLAQKFLYHPS